MEVLDLEKHSLYIIKSHESDIKKIYLYAKDLFEAKCQLLIDKRGGSGLNQFNDNFIEYSNDIQDIYKNIEWYNPNKKRKKIDWIWWYNCWYAY